MVFDDDGDGDDVDIEISKDLIERLLFDACGALTHVFVFFDLSNAVLFELKL